MRLLIYDNFIICPYLAVFYDINQCIVIERLLFTTMKIVHRSIRKGCYIK